jgi:hypothetical protein
LQRAQLSVALSIPRDGVGGGRGRVRVHNCTYTAEDQEKLKEQPIQRLMKLAKERDRSVNYLVVQAIMEFLKREEKAK